MEESELDNFMVSSITTMNLPESEPCWQVLRWTVLQAVQGRHGGSDLNLQNSSVVQHSACLCY
jgi:hypothetical protein